MRVLLIEDSIKITEAVSLCFELRWPEAKVISTSTGSDGIAIVETESPDVVILDLGLPDIDGFTVLKNIRNFSDVPIIILTVTDGEMHKVKGLELGADDYIVKPFSHIELLARIKAVLRRSTMPQLKDTEEAIISTKLRINFATATIHRNGETVKLTPIESHLLYQLVRNEGNTLSHRCLLEKVWGEDHLDAIEYLKVYIQRLRNKLEDNPSHPRILMTERGTGYKFIKPTSPELKPAQTAQTRKIGSPSS